MTPKPKPKCRHCGSNHMLNRVWSYEVQQFVPYPLFCLKCKRYDEESEVSQ